jgi:transposase
MERLETKRINGHTYYYFSRWERRDGRCRRVWQQYLGKLEDIVKAVNGELIPLYAELFDFGLPAAFWSECRRQRVIEIIDRVCPKREQALSVGQYLALAAINRAADPVSKMAMYEWFSHTSLRRHIDRADESALSSQRFWDHMDIMAEATAQRAWQSIIKGALKREKIDLNTICYDGTNFYSFINTFNMRSTIAARGKNKQGRSNLRQVSYGLFCTTDGIPLFYDVYEGNRQDAKEFSEVIERFKEFLGGVAKEVPAVCGEHITVIFDKGNNSEPNVKTLDGHMHFVGSLKLDEHKELATISNTDDSFVNCQRPSLGGHKVWEVRRHVYGCERRVLVCFNPKLYESQLKTLNNDIAKVLDKLSELKQRLNDREVGLTRGGRAPTVDSVKRQSSEFCKRPFIGEIVTWSVAMGTKAPVLTYEMDSSALARVCDTYLGKKLLVTSRDKWDAERVIEAYHSQYVIEHIFRDMKDRNFGTWWPMHHWTDQKVRVHGFYCTVAVLLRTLLHRRARQGGLCISMKRMLKELAGIKEVVNVYKEPTQKRKGKMQTTLTKQTELQDRLIKILGLSRPLLRT